MTKPSYAIFSCDLDTIDRHLQGYGVEDLPACDVIYRTAVPRLLEMLEGLGAPCVFFTIARDAEAERPLLRELVRAGHEIASHSMTHPQPFSTLPDEELREEIAGSRTRLSEASGSEVVGFRAPAWDVDDRVLSMVASSGYRYDASVFPTPALLASRISAWRRGEGKGAVFAMDLLGHAFSRRTPYRLKGAGDGLFEFPVAVTRWLRFPTYHTLAYFLPDAVFSRALNGLLRGGQPVCYEFHAADVLSLDDEGVDRRMDRHPGMKLAVDEKLAMLRRICETIAARRETVTYRDAVDRALVA